MKHLRRSTMTERPLNFRLDHTNPLADGLVFAGLGAYTGGTYYHDSSMQGLHGLLTNMEPASDWLWDATLERWVVDFDGSNDVVVGSTSSVFNSKANTLSFWINRTGGANSAIIIGKERDNGASDRPATFYVDVGSNGNTLRFVYTDVNTYHAYSWGANSIVAGTAHYAVSFIYGTGTTIKGYRNGNLLSGGGWIAGSGNSPNTANAEPLRLMAYSTTAPLLFNKGTLGDPLIHSRALSPSEIAQLADPSSVMLAGLILPPLRKLWRVAPAAAAGRFPLELMGAY